MLRIAVVSDRFLTGELIAHLLRQHVGPVVDPFPAPRPRRPKHLEARGVGDPSARLVAFVEAAGERGLTADAIPVRLGVPPGQVASLIDLSGDIVPAGGRLFSPDVVQNARDATIRALEDYHRRNPLEPGMPRELARQVVQDEALADKVQSLLEEQERVAIEGRVVRLSDFSATLSKDQVVLREALRAELLAAGFEGRTVTELAAGPLGDKSADLLAFCVREGTTTRVGKDRYYDPGELAKLVKTVLQEIVRLNRVTPADLREKTGLSRKYLIPLLEWMDGQSLTVRLGDSRGLGPAASDY